MKTPDIIFSNWFAWTDLKDIPDRIHKGIYLVARYQQKPSGHANPLDQEVLYIGITTGEKQSLHTRISSFLRAAQSEKKVAHSGGNTFNIKQQRNMNNLYVSVFAPQMEVPYQTAFIKHVERKLLWDYVVKWHSLPICNSD